MNIGNILSVSLIGLQWIKSSIKEIKALHIGELKILATSEFAWLNTARDT